MLGIEAAACIMVLGWILRAGAGTGAGVGVAAVLVAVFTAGAAVAGVTE